MGLDMSLIKKKKNSEEKKELIYWRKANQIRKWFVDHLEDFNQDDNGGEYVISKETIIQLIDDIVEVQKYPNKAQEIMPTSNGFFFGSQDYDSYYFDTLQSTLNDLFSILNNVDFQTEDVIYTECW